MILNSMGMNARHEDTFLIDRPRGLGDNLLLIFKSEARVFDKGEWRYLKPGSFIVYRKESQQKYGALGKEYIDHYIHFDAVDETAFDNIGLWTDVAAYLNNIDEIENIIRLLSREQISNYAYHKENEDLFLQLLFRKLSENQCENPKEAGESRHLEELTSLRSEMYSTPGKYGSIAELAQAVNLSISHFQALYSNFFGVSGYDDLLNARMNCAKGFLRNSTLSVREIASLCGYENDTCFMRSFKKIVGKSPSEFRNMK